MIVQHDLQLQNPSFLVKHGALPTPPNLAESPSISIDAPPGPRPTSRRAGGFDSSTVTETMTEPTRGAEER